MGGVELDICPTGVNWGRCLIVAAAAEGVAEGVAVLNTGVVDVVVAVVMRSSHVLTANMPPGNIITAATMFMFLGSFSGASICVWINRVSAMTRCYN
jgi:hypothetical protein